MHILLYDFHKKRANKIKQDLAKLSLLTDVFFSIDSVVTRLNRRVSEYSVLLFCIDDLSMDVSEVCKQLQKSDPHLPIIVYSTVDDVFLAIEVLWSYADDFVRLPVHSLELAARIHAVARRPRKTDDQTYLIGDLVLDGKRACVYLDGEEIIFSQKEYLILETLAKHSPQVVSRTELQGSAWEVPDVTAQNTLTAHIKNIRRKLSRSKQCKIETRRNVGYQILKNG